jgi:hypothetical protein
MITYAFSGRLTDANSKSFLPHPFTIPPGATKIDVRFEYGPRTASGLISSNLLCLSLFGPEGWRGTGHNRKNNNFTVSAAEATPGFMPGPLPPGEWTVVIETHLVMPELPVEYQMEIDISDEPRTGEAPDWKPAHTAPRGPGWYRGDLHGHTVHSDGSWTVSDFVQYARDYKLDFVTLTDHNTVSGLAEAASYANDDLLVMGGIELTTFYGHCLALGARTWVDWRARPDYDMTAIARTVLDSGALYVIAHPRSVGDPYCTGCDWGYPEMMPGISPAVEVWNSPWEGDSNNNDAVRLWYDWLNAGHRLVATAGTDIHGPNMLGMNFGFNIVYADALTEAAILEGIRRGHLYISGGPALEFSAAGAGGQSAMMGDTLPAGDAAFTAKWSGTTEGEIARIIGDGRILHEQPASTVGEHTWSADANKWYAVEIRDANGYLRALTNPIFVGE